MNWLSLLLLFLLFHQIQARNSSDPPEITAVAAMCSSDGITASVDFDGPFSGKIYSLDYANVHDCIYYNALDMDTILFSIPAHRCGTRLSRTSRNIVDTMINRVYVQMDRDFQSSHDKQFSFVCQLADGRKENDEKSEIRRAPQRDTGYVTAPPLSPSVTPVKAMSTDARQFGNWPIPGSKTYDPSYMKPTAVFPQYAVGPPISPILDPNSYAKPDVFPQRSPPTPQYALPTGKPIFSQRDPVVPIRGPQIPHNVPVKATAYQLPPPQDNYAHPPSSPFWPQSQTPAPQRAAPIVPNIVKKHQGIGFGIQNSKEIDDFTKVPAQTWNMGTTIGYVRGPESEIPSVQRSEPVVSSRPTGSHTVQSAPAKVFKEEPPRIGFTSDDNSVRDQTVSVNTEPLISKQEAKPTDVFLEIQKGDGPFSPPVAGPVKIGENISLVVRSTTKMKSDNEYDMFVHSCFATDGPGSTRVQLTDEKSCVLRKEFVTEVHRARSGQQQFYFFRLAAFKFPGPDDVYFSCSIELTPNRTAPAVCPPLGVRWKREIRPENQMRLFDIVKVELAEQWEQQKRLIEAASCISPLVLTALSSAVLVLLVSLLAVSYLAMSQHFRLQSQLKH